MTNEDTARWITDHGYNTAPIVCDSAEQKSVADYRSLGLTARPAAKGAGSVDYGMKWLQGRTIVIDAKRTPHAAEEFVHYEYERDRTGPAPSSPVTQTGTTTPSTPSATPSTA